MKHKVLTEHGSSTYLNPMTIYILGPRKLQNEMLASYLTEQIGVDCLVCEAASAIPEPGDTVYEGQGKLVLWDCRGKDRKSVLAGLGALVSENKPSQCSVFLFNGAGDLRVEEIRLFREVRGISFLHDSLDKFVEGVNAVLSGSFWPLLEKANSGVRTAW